jgi:hypothetical protein
MEKERYISLDLRMGEEKVWTKPGFLSERIIIIYKPIFNEIPVSRLNEFSCNERELISAN